MTMFMDYGVDKNNWTANNVERGVQFRWNSGSWNIFRAGFW